MRGNISSEDLREVIELLNTKDPKLTSGPKVEKFEKEWSEWLGVKYSLFVNSGSSANLLAIAALKNIYPEGGKVIVPPLTWSSDISSLLWIGFEPIFVDINLKTLALDEDKLEESIERYSDIRAVFITHAQGFNGLTAKILRLCEKNSIHIIEDVCEAHGAMVDGTKKAGSVGIMSCFSYYYAHHMSTIEGGMVCTNNQDLYNTLRLLRGHGLLRESKNNDYQEYYKAKYTSLNPDFIFPLAGFNVRNTEIGAIIGSNQLKRLDANIKKRNENFLLFIDNLSNKFFKNFAFVGQSNYAFNLVLAEKDKDFWEKLRVKLKDEEIEFRCGSAGGGNQLRQPYLENHVKENGVCLEDFQNCDHIHFFGMYLGNYPELKKEDIKYITKVINNV